MPPPRCSAPVKLGQERQKQNAVPKRENRKDEVRQSKKQTNNPKKTIERKNKFKTSNNFHGMKQTQGANKMKQMEA